MERKLELAENNIECFGKKSVVEAHRSVCCGSKVKVEDEDS